MKFVECESMKNDERFKFFNRCTDAEKKLHFVRTLNVLDKKKANHSETLKKSLEVLKSVKQAYEGFDWNNNIYFTVDELKEIENKIIAEIKIIEKLLS